MSWSGGGGVCPGRGMVGRLVIWREIVLVPLGGPVLVLVRVVVVRLTRPIAAHSPKIQGMGKVPVQGWCHPLHLGCRHSRVL